MVYGKIDIELEHYDSTFFPRFDDEAVSMAVC